MEVSSPQELQANLDEYRGQLQQVILHAACTRRGYEAEFLGIGSRR